MPSRAPTTLQGCDGAGAGVVGAGVGVVAGVVGAAVGAGDVGDVPGRLLPEPDELVPLSVTGSTGGTAASLGSGVEPGSASAVTVPAPGAGVVGSVETEGRAASASERESPPPIASDVKANVMNAATATVATTAIATSRESRFVSSMGTTSGREGRQSSLRRGAGGRKQNRTDDSFRECDARIVVLASGMQFDVQDHGSKVRPSLVLVNSVVAAQDEGDALADVVSAGSWFAAVAGTLSSGELGDDLTVDGDRLDALREVRGAVEQILLARPRASSLAVVNRYETESAPSWGLDLDARGELHVRRRLWGPGVESWLGVVAADCIGLVRDGGRERIATCATPSCRIVLLPEHHRQRYCSAACAHRTRQARYQRVRATAENPG